jgi:CYTH domain-containing protein
LAEEFYHFPYADFVSCKQNYETQGNKLSHISVIVETNDAIITLVFGSKAWRRKSYLGKFLLQDSKEFCTIMERHCLEKDVSSLSADQ